MLCICKCPNASLLVLRPENLVDRMMGPFAVAISSRLPPSFRLTPDYPILSPPSKRLGAQLSFLQLPAQNGVLQFNTEMGNGPVGKGGKNFFYDSWLKISRAHVALSIIAIVFWWITIAWKSKLFAYVQEQ